MTSCNLAKISASGFLHAFVAFLPTVVKTRKCFGFIFIGASALNRPRKSNAAESCDEMGTKRPIGSIKRPPVSKFILMMGVAVISLHFQKSPNTPSGTSKLGKTDFFQSNLHSNDSQIGSLGSFGEMSHDKI